MLFFLSVRHGFNFVISRTPTGLQDVADYPNLFARLLEDGWSEDDVIKLAGGNLLRVLDAAEKVFFALNLADIMSITREVESQWILPNEKRILA